MTIDTTLLRAKLSPPQPVADQIIRQRLVDELDRRSPAGRLIIISAPPGYGKTTLAAQWLSTRGKPGAWLTIDALDNDLGGFAAYLVAAVKTAYPHAGRHTGSLLNAPQAVPPSALADALIEDLASLPGALVLVLDDYHLITDSEVSVLMTRLVQFMPTNVQIVLTTRTDPELPLSRLRGLGQIAEFRTNDLQFTNDETRHLLSNLSGETIDEQVAAQLGDRMEGWAIGLRFAALARHQGETMASLARRFAHEGQGMTSDYLLDEVLEKQTPAVRDFLLRTAILERLSEHLCAAVTGPTGEVGMLGRLWHANLLITPLDEQRTWFRYHPLFRELLLRWLHESCPAETVGELHRRAALWLSKEGLIGEALSHAVAANDKALAVRLIEENVHEALNREQWWRIAHWLELLPEQFIDHPAFLVARGWVLNFQLRIKALAVLTAESSARLERARDRVTPAERTLLQAQIDVQNAAVAYWTGDVARAARLVEDSLSLLSPDMAYARSICHVYYTAAERSMGHGDKARRYLQQRMAEQVEALPVFTARLFLTAALMSLESGDMAGFKEGARSLARVGEQGRLPATIGWAHFSLGLAAYEMNDLELARQYWQAVEQSLFQVNGRTATDSFIGLTLVLEAQGERGLADNTVERLRDFLVEANYLESLPLGDALATRLSLSRGQNVSTLNTTQPSPEDARIDLRRSFVLSPLLTTVRVLLRDATSENLAAAGAILTASHQAAKDLHEKRRLVEIGALEAIYFDATGDHRRALDALIRSLKIAEPGRLLRIFVDCGPALIPLLRRAREHGGSPTQIQHILDAFANTTTTTAAATQSANDDSLLALRATLTNREVDVLNLLDLRLSNQEIADRLYVEPETIKKHLQNLYRKLGVNNRRGAIALARHVGLLT